MGRERLGVVKAIVLMNRVEGLQEELETMSKKIEELEESRRIVLKFRSILMLPFC